MTNPPAGDTPTINVRVAEIADGAAGAITLPARPRRQRITVHKTVVLTTTNPVQPLLATDDTRIRAVIMVAGAIGAAPTAASFGWLTDTEAQANGAASHGDGSIGSYISAVTTPAPIPVSGHNSLWAALDNNATANLTLTVITDCES